MKIRTRMAPSPTGEFHIGSMRTLLYAYSFAKKHKGKFILRIEDTDRSRYVEGAEERLKDVIKEYGFSWDEYYVQSERLDIYRKHIKKLIDSGHAYPCFCSEERLKKMREDQQKKHLPPKYDRRCLNLSKKEIQEKLDAGESHVIRLKIPNDTDITFYDEVLGEISFPSKDIDDQILIKADGYPTYHFAVVVDDHLMKITHIMRGCEWVPSTPKHVVLYKAFGWEIPKFVHLPLLKEVGSNKKFSKRQGSVSAVDFLKEGYIPEALNNFLMFLGWNSGTEKEFYSLDEFIEDFSLDRVQKTDLVSFDRKKLLWMNGSYIRNLSLEEVWNKLNHWAQKFEVNLNKSKDKEFDLKVLSLVRERMRIFSEYNDSTGYFYDNSSLNRDFLHEYSGDPNKTKEILKNFIEDYQSISNWNFENIEHVSHNILKKHNYSPKEAFMTLRIASTGEKATPPLFDIFNLLGKEESIFRLESALKDC